MSLAITTIAANLAELTVTGLNKIYDIDAIPPDCTRLTPCLIPEPLGYVTDFVVERNSQGSGGTAKMTVTYNLHYTFLFVGIGEGRTGLDYYGDMVGMAYDILDVMIENDDLAGAIDLMIDDILEFGPVPDPSGNQYLGCRITLHVTEFVN